MGSFSATSTSVDVGDLVEQLSEEEAESEPASLDFLNCPKCDAIFNNVADLNSHDVFHHSAWPLVYGQNQEEPVQVLYVCSDCYRQYELAEDLRRHMIEFHKYVPINRQQQDDRVVRGAAGGSKDKVKKEAAESPKAPKAPEAVAAGCSSKVESPTSSTPKPSATLASVLESHPLPFKEFRVLLRSKMLLSCPVSTSCSYKFESRAKTEFHVGCHAANTAKNKFKCKECGLEFTSWRRCSSHLWKIHQEDVDMMQCPICGYKAHASILVWRHMRFHKMWRPRVLKYMRAARGRRQSGAAKKKTVETPKPVKPKKNKYYSEKTCDLCSRKFVNGKTLSKHVKSVHNKIKPFICNVCGKELARKSNLIVHMRQHTGEKPLQCQTCNFATRDPSVLKNHQKRHENGGRHKCTICDYVCIQTNAYKRHMRLNHPEEFKKISCHLCSFVSVSEERLRAHKEDHLKGLIDNAEESSDAAKKGALKNPSKEQGKHDSNADTSTDYLLPLESVDSLPHEPAVDTGGVTIPAPLEDTQFPTCLNN